MHNLTETSNLKTMLETLMNLAKCTYYNHIENNQRICIKNQLTGVYVKLILTENELSISTHGAHEFSYTTLIFEEEY